MKKRLVFAWLTAGIALFCIHYGPGQEWLSGDRAATLAAQAKKLEESGRWEEARANYEAAVAALPEEGCERQRTVLQMSRAWTYLNTADVAEATHQLQGLLEETRSSDAIDDDLLHDLRGALAHAEYYTAWHMRLENAPREQWRKELEVARQNFRYLGEVTPNTSARRNLEAAVLLARMNMEDLQGMPLPEKNSGRGSKGVSDKRRAQRGQPGGEAEGESVGEGEQEGDGKELRDARGQGLGRRPDGGGS